MPMLPPGARSGNTQTVDISRAEAYICAPDVIYSSSFKTVTRQYCIFSGGANTMKRILLLTIAVIALSCLLVAQAKNAKSTGKTSNVTDEIKQLEQQRNEAILKGDTATLDKLTSDDYTNTTAQGKIEKKADIMDGFKSGKIKFDSRELSNLDVRVYGNTAVVTGQVNQKSTNNGADTSGQNRFTRVYVKQNGRWVSVANQATAIPK